MQKGESAEACFTPIFSFPLLRSWSSGDTWSETTSYIRMTKNPSSMLLSNSVQQGKEHLLSPSLVQGASAQGRIESSQGDTFFPIPPFQAERRAMQCLPTEEQICRVPPCDGTFSPCPGAVHGARVPASGCRNFNPDPIGYKLPRAGESLPKSHEGLLAERKGEPRSLAPTSPKHAAPWRWELWAELSACPRGSAQSQLCCSRL